MQSIGKGSMLWLKKRWKTNKLTVIESEDLGAYITLNRIIKADLIEKMTTGRGGNFKDSVMQLSKEEYSMLRNQSKQRQ